MNARVRAMAVAVTAILLGAADATDEDGAADPVCMRHITTLDTEFLVNDAHGAGFEYALAEAALGRTANELVRFYAANILHDHEVFNGALRQLGHRCGVELSLAPTEEQQARLAGLNRLAGDEFDRGFAREARRINDDDAAEIQREELATEIPVIRAFIGRFRRLDEAHSRELRGLPGARD